ncbi:MAG: hypothetical protein A3E01_15155 [Gammaproteobacteria bacterium RIFCSPHIGHO2_12_FULL_63_22]|nr:MAG: hypothetical protein A3E01_15155 [Gammaproteobacteria bacterium RIFCSPHIGHO2_12_FULL_63_22]
MKLKEALAGGGQLLAGAALLIGAIAGATAENQASPLDQVPNLNPFASSPAEWRCPDGFVETRGYDSDAASDFMACESPRYIIKKLTAGEPVGFDKETGKYLDPETLR